MIKQPQTNFRRILVANRSEIAIRVFRVSVELGVETIAIYSREDRFALRRFKADETYLIGCGMGPVEAYLSINEVIRVARANAVIADLPRNGGTGGGIPPLPLMGRAGPVAEHPYARVCPHLPPVRLPGRMAGSPCDTMGRPFSENGRISGKFDKFRYIQINKNNFLEFIYLIYMGLSYFSRNGRPKGYSPKMASMNASGSKSSRSSTDSPTPTYLIGMPLS